MPWIDSVGGIGQYHSHEHGRVKVVRMQDLGTMLFMMLLLLMMMLLTPTTKHAATS